MGSGNNDQNELGAFLRARRSELPVVGWNARCRETAGTRTYNHPIVGEITLDWDSLTSEADPDQHLIIYTAEPGSRSEQALLELAACAENIGMPWRGARSSGARPPLRIRPLSERGSVRLSSSLVGLGPCRSRRCRRAARATD
jgi:hypothetical protein